MIFAFKYMYMLLGVRNLDKLVFTKLFLNKRIQIQDRYGDTRIYHSQ